MKIIKHILHFFFGFKNTSRGFVIHAMLFVLYTCVAFVAWNYVENKKLPENYTNYYQINIYKLLFACIIFQLSMLSVFRWKHLLKSKTPHLLVFIAYNLFCIMGWCFLNKTMQPENYRIYYQMNLSHLLLVMMLAHAGILLISGWKKVISFLSAFFNEKGSPYNLAIFRVFFFFILAGHFLFYTPVAKISWASLPDTSRVSLPFMGWLVQNIPINPQLYLIASYSAGILCLFVCLGLFTRFALLLSLPAVFYALGVPMFFGKINHDHILLWICIIFCFAPLSDVWSLDALIKRLRKKTAASTEPHTKYLLPFKFIWIQLAIIYFFSGIVKLWDCGLEWALGDSMVNQMRWEWVEHYDKVPSIRLDNYPLIAKTAGLTVIYFELFYFVLILKPKTRIWAFITAFSFHRICGYFMYIDFIALRQIAASYIDWNKLMNMFKGIKETPLASDESVSALSFLSSEKLKTGFIVCLVLISINFLFSAFGIHSFPFSSYPTYSALVKDEISLIRMEASDKAGKKINVKALAQQTDFRWENIRPYETRIGELFEKNDTSTLNVKLNEYWLLWKNNVKGLEDVAELKMYLETTKIKPEERQKVLSSVFLGKLNPLNP